MATFAADFLRPDFNERLLFLDKMLETVYNA